jgi:tetratricopeptide (TPR) repeat protein
MRLLITTGLVAFAVALGVFAVGRGGDDTAPNPRAVPQLPPPTAPTAQRLAALREVVRAAPGRADGWTLLAGAELQRVRETGDAGEYAKAQAAVDRALSLKPGDQAALTERAALELSRHDFRAGLRDARAAHRVDPTVVAPYGPLVDASVELGRYGDAERLAQQMADRRPDLAALSRVSYLRELRGDRPGALDALRAAQSAGGAMPEADAFVASLVAGLELQLGHVGAARHEARQALHDFPGYGPAEAALARADAARGDVRRAIGRMRALVERLPLPEHVTLLAELELSAGQRAAAARDLDLVRAERRLQQSAGVIVDTEAALFEADHGDPRKAIMLAQRAWASAPSVRSADALGYALTRAGRPREGLRWARRALARGWRDPNARLHAGLAAAGAGDARHATTWLHEALRGAAFLGPWQARHARSALATLDEERA